MAKAKRFKLTTPAKVLLMVIIIALLGVGAYSLISTGIVTTTKNETVVNKTPNKNNTTSNNVVADTDGNVINTVKTDDKTINLSLDEWIGWKEIIDANGGYSTVDGSIFDQLGLDVNISIINDATQSSNALIAGSLDACGYTINRTAFLSQKFKNANIDVVMPYITNFSNGGDGIIATTNINSVEDLVGAKIGVPEFSEAHSLVIWFVNNSDLTDEQKSQIIDNLIFFETPDEVAKAFFSGQIEVGATWQPYLTQAQNMTDAHVLFSTVSSSSLIMDGILFNKDFAEANPDVVTTFIKGCLMASDMYTTNTDTIKAVMPMYSITSDEDIIANCADAKLTTYADNINLFKTTAKSIYAGMCDVWASIGEEVAYECVDTIFDDKYILPLASEFGSSTVTKTDAMVTVTEENKQTVLDANALLQKSATVNFLINTAKFSDSATATQTLDEFIEIAKILDGTIIEIAGNCDPNPVTDPTDEANKKLSYQRAETVKNYFVMSGISADRIIVVGNGSSNPIVENDTEAHKAMNRRTDVSFKCVEF